MIRFYLGAGVVVAFLFLGMYAQNQHLRAVSAEAAGAALQREVEVRDAQIAQAALARRVAAAEAQRHAAKANELDRIKEAILKGDEDADIPAWFRAYLERLLSPPN